MRALIVEDSTTIRMILCKYLRQLNIEVVEAADGLQALERLNEMGLPDLVLVDWDMPAMNGIDFIRAVRQQIDEPLPLIMVTTHSQDDYRSEAVAAGASEYIQKPCTLDMLREKLDLLGLLKS